MNKDLPSLQRIQSTIVADKKFKPDNMSKILKSEIVNILENYLLLEKDSVNLTLSVNAYGFLELNISALAKRSKIVSVLPDENSFI